MTERHAGYVIVLSENVRADDAAPIMAAIRMIKGVADVRPVLSDTVSVVAEARAQYVLRQKLMDVLKTP